MGLHIYCIVNAAREPDAGLTGIDGARVRAAHDSDIGVWFSEHEHRPPADTAALRAHNAVVQAGMTSDATPVPVRFGQWFETDAAVLAQVHADTARWLALLARFAGCAEYGIRIDADRPPQPARDVRPARPSGTQYMATLARRHADAEQRRAEGEAIASRIHDTLSEIVVAARVEFPVGTLVSLAHLVAQRRAGDYHVALDAFRRSRSDLRFWITGPWPPYTFVS